MSRKFGIWALAFTLLLSASACSNQVQENGTSGEDDVSSISTNGSSSETSGEIQTDSSSESEEELDRMIGIPGSHIKDIQLGVERFGMEDASAQGAPDGAPYRWAADKHWLFPDTTVELDYSIIGDDDSQLISGSFGTTWDAVSDNGEFVTASEYYLGFIATMPYDTSDTGATKQWLLDSLDKVTEEEPLSTTVGDAIFTLSVTGTDEQPTSYLLQIQVAESE